MRLRIGSLGYWPLVLLPLPFLLYSTTLNHEHLYLTALIFVIQPAMLMIVARCASPEALTPAFQWLGAISYGLYALHLPIQIVTEFVARSAMGVPLFNVPAPPISLVATLAIVFPLAHYLTYRLDMPVQKWAARRLARASAPGRAPSHVVVPDAVSVVAAVEEPYRP